ncbi:MAG: DEAD/DEAH box helicase family protein, partial [Actinomycetospora chiangmaiensis]|nr:DEAD/DEAH box helicase family protein [Actinomycetospora chiangmaiensis]
MPTVAEIQIPLAIDTPYSYVVPHGLAVEAGDVVQVPLGPRETVGVVWSVTESVGGSNLRPVTGVLEVPRRVAPRGSALAMVLRLPDEAAGTEIARVAVKASGKPPARPTAARTKVLAIAADGELRGKSALAKEAGVSLSVVDGLIDDGALEALAIALEPIAPEPDPDHPRVPLSDAQAQAAAALAASLGEATETGAARPVLLEGVTGSGKTEVYFEAVAACIREGRQALILIPEIALTAQFL